MHYAAFSRCKDTVQLLLDGGADSNLVKEGELIPFELLSRSWLMDVIEMQHNSGQEQE